MPGAFFRYLGFKMDQLSLNKSAPEQHIFKYFQVQQLC